MTKPTGARDELRALIDKALTEPDPAAALMRLAYRVDDDWDTVYISTFGDPDAVMYQRYLVVRIPRQALTRRADRSVE